MKYPNGATHEKLFKNPILRVNIVPIEYLVKSCPEWKPIDRLDEVRSRDTGLYEQICEPEPELEDCACCA